MLTDVFAEGRVGLPLIGKSETNHFHWVRIVSCGEPCGLRQPRFRQPMLAEI